MLLAASWGWVWTTTAAARANGHKASSLTAACFAERAVRAELSRALCLASPSEGICGVSTLCLRDVDTGVGGTSITTITWDPSRKVLWRNASGSYLAEHVFSFTLGYLDGAGEALPPSGSGVLDMASREAVRAIRVEMTIGQHGEERHVVLVESLAAAGAR